MDFYISYALYILTFIFGFLLNKKNDSSVLKRIFIVWLYVFLCFGYMTGSDWRSYELNYANAVSFGLTNFQYDSGFNLLFVLLGKIITDFFLALGILKCLYLYTLCRLLKAYTSNWLAAISVLMPMSLIFMLIDNPLRFMTALIWVNMGLYCMKRKKIVKTYACLIAAIFFHATTIAFLIFPVIIKCSKSVARINSLVLVLLYVVISYVSSNASLIELIKNSIVSQLMMVMEMKDYTLSYNIENNEAFFTLGSMIQIVLFGIIVLSKSRLKKDSESISLFGLSIIYLFILRVLIMVPTGFRLAIPFGYYYALYVVYMLYRREIVGYLITVYLAFVMTKNIFGSYTYAPYTNSIEHIITQDYDSYEYRSNYNPNAFVMRTGKPHGIKNK